VAKLADPAKFGGVASKWRIELEPLDWMSWEDLGR